MFKHIHQCLMIILLFILEPIKPPFITLKFTQLSTECVYDYIFVYDGSSSSNSTLLGSFSGRDSVPNRVLIAESGSMLIVLFRYITIEITRIKNTNFYIIPLRPA